MNNDKAERLYSKLLIRHYPLQFRDIPGKVKQYDDPRKEEVKEVPGYITDWVRNIKK